jgi:hypothetical protein
MNINFQLDYEVKKEKIISDLEKIKEKNQILMEEFIKLDEKNREEFDNKEKFLSKNNKIKAIYNAKKKLIDLKSEILNKKMNKNNSEISKNLKNYKNFILNFHSENKNIFTKDIKIKLDENDSIKCNIF